MTTKILFALLASATLIVLSGCSDFNTTPDITGVADDGLYLYSGNMRYTSDYENGEELVLAVDIDEVTYSNIEFCDALYIGDDAYMSINYYENDTLVKPLGNCVIKYNVADKSQQLIYNCPLDEKQGERYFVDEILWVGSDGSKIAGVAQYSDSTLIIYDGEVMEELPDNAEYAFDNDFYAFADYRDITCMSWDGEKVNQFENVYRIENLEIYDTKLYAYTCYTYQGEQWRDENWLYNCEGLECYDPFSGELLFMDDPSTHYTTYTDLQTGFSIMGQMNAHIIDGETWVYATDFDLYLFEGGAFYYFCNFEDSTADWTYYTPEVRGDYIIFGGCGEEDGEFVTGKKCYFNLKTRSFEADPELPVEISAEYGDYYFYIDYFGPLIIAASQYIELHRVNKLTGADDVMAYEMVDYKDYNIDIVRDY